VSDPESARCENPNPTFGQAMDLGDHREVDAHFTSEGAVLAGTLYLSEADGRFPAVVWVHGSGEQPRLNYGSVVAPLVEQEIAVFSYDKRGIGESEGDCCTSPGHYNLVAADADGAVAALRSRADIDPAGGVLRRERGGWTPPR
jgi:alpha-beta hydrolase superfamily lysophospholipase